MTWSPVEELARRHLDSLRNHYGLPAIFNDPTANWVRSCKWRSNKLCPGVTSAHLVRLMTALRPGDVEDIVLAEQAILRTLLWAGFVGYAEPGFEYERLLRQVRTLRSISVFTDALRHVLELFNPSNALLARVLGYVAIATLMLFEEAGGDPRHVYKTYGPHADRAAPEGPEYGSDG